MSSLALKQRIDELLTRIGEDRVSTSDIRTALKEMVDYIDENNVVSDLSAWNIATTYSLNEIVIESDRIWKSKINNNTGNQPPQDGQVSEDTNWIEISKGTNLSDWSPGLFGSGLVITFFDNKFYKLNVPNRPYESSDINTEIAAGDWEIVNGDYIPTTALTTDSSLVSVNDTQVVSALAVKMYVASQIASLIDTALGDDPNFATTISTALSLRLRVDQDSQGLTNLQKQNGIKNLLDGVSLAAETVDPAYKVLIQNNSGAVRTLTTQEIADLASPGGQSPTSGTYTPTVTGGAGVNSIGTIRKARWINFGNFGFVSGAFSMNNTTTPGATIIVDISLPIASNFIGNSDEASGIISNAAHSGRIGSNSNDNLRAVIIASGSSDSEYYFNATFDIIP